MVVVVVSVSGDFLGISDVQAGRCKLSGSASSTTKKLKWPVHRSASFSGCSQHTDHHHSYDADSAIDSPNHVPISQIIHQTAEMITRFITEVKTAFNPFSPKAKTARLFLSFLPPDARANGMVINTQLLARSSTAPSSLSVKFSMYSNRWSLFALVELKLTRALA